MNDLRSRVEGERCAACGAPFHCGGDEAECWCAALPPLTPTAGRSCLCKKCLEEELKAASQRT